jgi:hypothetical protein
VDGILGTMLFPLINAIFSARGLADGRRRGARACRLRPDG